MDSPSQSDELADLLLADLEEHAEHNTATNNEPQAQTPKESPESVTALLFDAPQAEPAPKRQKLEASSRGGTCPPHPGFIGGICIRCGVDKPIAPHAFAKKSSSRNGHRVTDNATAIASATDAFAASPSPLALKYIHHGLEVSRGEAARLRQDTVQKALLSRRLLLVLDLDHTLLHSTRVIDVSPEDTDALTEQMKNQDPLDPTLYHIPYMGMWTKLRPGLRTFLSRVKEMYDLHVFTMGDKDYAAGMAALIDPDGRLFGGRVASSSDAGAGMVKDIDVLLGAEELVVILDDTAAVWPKHRHNLIQVDRYIYFPSCAAKFGSSGQSHLEQRKDEHPTEGMLEACLRVLTALHCRFFERHDGATASTTISNPTLTTNTRDEIPTAVTVTDADNSSHQTVVGDTKIASSTAVTGPPDVRILLRDIRSNVLSTCCILFSRVVPRDATDPTLHPMWQLALQLGARCVTEQCDEVTHVVAAGTTAKSNWALQTGKHAVSPGWLWHSAFMWERADELGFPVQSTSSTNGIPMLLTEEEEKKAALAGAGGGSLSLNGT